MAKEAAIRVKGVHKNFKLPNERISSLKGIVTNGFKRQKGYEVQHALSDIDFTINQGEFFGIVGRNGSGKSTLLKILAGIYRPSKGSVETHGKLVPFIELGVGFNPELTGKENVYLNGALLGFTKAEIDELYGDIVAFAELEEFMGQKLKNYSSGMQVRLAFSVATRAKADILLVDEVLAVGDADFQRKCFKYFQQLKRDHKTVVFVSHDMNAVREYCDRALLIEKSRIVKQGNVADVASSYTKLFIQGEGSSEQKMHRKRWGNGKVHYTDIRVKPVYTERDDNIHIIAQATVTEAMDKPVFGFTIKNGAGTEMMGSNTKLSKYETRQYKAGETVTIQWTIPNILNEGQYSLDVTIIDHRDADDIDWWEDSAVFDVVRTEHTAYAVEPKVKFEEVAAIG